MRLRSAGRPTETPLTEATTENDIAPASSATEQELPEELHLALRDPSTKRNREPARLRSLQEAETDQVLKPIHRSAVTKSQRSRKPQADRAFRGNVRANNASKRLQECTICAEKQGKRRFAKTEAAFECGHGTDVCHACIMRFTANLLEAHGRWDRVTCIECSSPVTQAELSKILPQNDFARLEIIVARKTDEAHPHFRPCLSTDCNYGQIHDDMHNPQVQCHICDAVSCFTHGGPWHEGYTCDEYDNMYPDAVSLKTSEERIRSVAKRCPGEDCGVYIEKDGGCEHMSCSRCGHSWMWYEVKFGDEDAEESSESEGDGLVGI